MTALPFDVSDDAAPLADLIARRLSRDIMRGDYRPGDRVREQEVADRLAVSRGPVREALQILEQDGLIETLPWKGARVVLLTLTDVEDLFLVSASLMLLVARFAAIRATDEELERFVELVAASAQTALPPNPVPEQLSAAFGYGTYLFEIGRCPQVAAMEQRIVRKLYWQHRVLNEASAAWRRKAYEGWLKFAHVLVTRDEARVARAMAAISRHGRTEVFRIHRKLGSGVYRLFEAAPRDPE